MRLFPSQSFDVKEASFEGNFTQNSEFGFLSCVSSFMFGELPNLSEAVSALQAFVWLLPCVSSLKICLAICVVETLSIFQILGLFLPCEFFDVQ